LARRTADRLTADLEAAQVQNAQHREMRDQIAALQTAVENLTEELRNTRVPPNVKANQPG
jgi:transcription elongation GreA/GreB family factor